ncbi:hypothetical protein D3C86_2066480 [compost metagenome]
MDDFSGDDGSANGEGMKGITGPEPADCVRDSRESAHEQMRKQQDAKVKIAGPDLIGGDKQKCPQLCGKMQSDHKPVNPQ